MSEINWITAKEYQDITYKKCNGVARIAFSRPEVRNALRLANEGIDKWIPEGGDKEAYQKLRQEEKTPKI